LFFQKKEATKSKNLFLIFLQFGLFLISRTRLLAQSPQLGRVVPEFEDPVIREIVVRSYRVVYRLDDSRHLVEVIRFWHAARDTPEINSA